VYGNGRGIYGGDGSSAIECNALQNGSQGIYLANGALVESCTARGNEGSGIEVGIGSSVLNCSVRENEGDGIKTDNGCTIRGCTVTRNVNNGILVHNDCTVAENNCVENNLSLPNRGGIHVSYASRTRILNNRVSGSKTGIRITQKGNFLSGNIVLNSGATYDIVAGNQLDLLLSSIPQTIPWPAYVKLTGTLTATSIDNGIVVESDDVTIDLAGHSLIGGGDDSGYGIHQSDTYSRLRVLNGTLAGWRGTDRAGIMAEGDSNEIDHVRVADCYWGIICYKKSRISDCSAVDCLNDGIYGGDGVVITECVAENNGNVGIYCYNGVMSRCTSRSNTNNAGIFVGPGSTVESSSSTGNHYGIRADDDASILNCTVSGSGTHGIDVGSRCHVAKCLSNGNGTSGAGSAIHVRGEGNRIEGNHAGTSYIGMEVTGTNNFVAANTMVGSTNNSSIAAGNHYGLIVVNPGANFTLAQPWANFEF